VAERRAPADGAGRDWEREPGAGPLRRPRRGDVDVLRHERRGDRPADRHDGGAGARRRACGGWTNGGGDRRDRQRRTEVSGWASAVRHVWHAPCCRISGDPSRLRAHGEH
jgi:hypothetical protein